MSLSRDDAEALRKAADLLERNPGSWAKTGELALNANGFAVPSKSAEACSFCMMGAVERALPWTLNEWELEPAIVALAEFLEPDAFEEDDPKEDALINIIGSFNDSPDVTLDMVLTALRGTASQLEASA